MNRDDYLQRIELARTHPIYEHAMAAVPMPPSIERLAVAIVIFAAVAAAPWIGLAMATHPPFVLFPVFAVISLGAGLAMLDVCLFHSDMRSAPLRRELCAVMSHRSLGTNAIYILWSPRMPSRKHALQRGPFACRGDVGVAVFRGKHLAGFLPIPLAQ